MDMTRRRIGIIGDFNPEYLYHQATNQALEISARRLGVELVYTWMPTETIARQDRGVLDGLDGFGHLREVPTGAWKARSWPSASRVSGASPSSGPEGGSNILC